MAAPRSLTVVHMEAPCFFGLTQIAPHALAAAEGALPLEDITVSIRGAVLPSPCET